MEGQQTSLGCLRVALTCRISRDQIVETGKTSLEEENGNLDAEVCRGKRWKGKRRVNELEKFKRRATRSWQMFWEGQAIRNVEEFGRPQTVTN